MATMIRRKAAGSEDLFLVEFNGDVYEFREVETSSDEAVLLETGWHRAPDDAEMILVVKEKRPPRTI